MVRLKSIWFQSKLENYVNALKKVLAITQCMVTKIVEQQYKSTKRE